MRAERAGATRTHARSVLAGTHARSALARHTRGARWLDTARSALAPMCAERTAVESRHMEDSLLQSVVATRLRSWPDIVARVWQTLFSAFFRDMTTSTQSDDQAGERRARAR